MRKNSGARPYFTTGKITSLVQECRSHMAQHPWGKGSLCILHRFACVAHPLRNLRDNTFTFSLASRVPPPLNIRVGRHFCADMLCGQTSPGALQAQRRCLCIIEHTSQRNDLGLEPVMRHRWPARALPIDAAEAFEYSNELPVAKLEGRRREK